MNIEIVLKILKSLLLDYLTDRKSKRFSGKITITLDCKDGGIGNVRVNAEQSFSKKILLSERQ